MVILFLLGFLGVFWIGRMAGRVEATLEFNIRIQKTIAALKKVETLAMLKGEDVSKLSTEELVSRANKQMVVTDDTES